MHDAIVVAFAATPAHVIMMIAKKAWAYWRQPRSQDVIAFAAAAAQWHEVTSSDIDVPDHDSNFYSQISIP